ncbi:uncharacterized protein LOC110978494 [Acanthaster planci]|uniref:Uncharacterized protein LOC110978494 n=1 Tax=Acanthaster planci TaxID=133434 RepID=A0A8B7Y9J9_ACAPL|nr:uncharacterized protein LOC110978494 [Acanthaster planci]
METKAMLPDSTQSEAIPQTSSAASNRPFSTKDDSSGSSGKVKKSDSFKKKKKRKSEEWTTKSSKKKKLGKEKSHKEQKSSKKSKKGHPAAKKAEPEEQDSDLDLENGLKPIRDYVKDREDMLGQMFKCVLKADKLRAMLPDILKDVKVEELQHLCLLQLEGMSKSRIMSILAGEEMQSSSNEEESDLDLEKNSSKIENADDNLINSEVVDSTSSLPQATLPVGDVEEVVSLDEAEEELAGEEIVRGDSGAKDHAGKAEEDDVVSQDGSLQDADSETHQRYCDEDADVEDDDDDDEDDPIRRSDEDSEADSVVEESFEEDQEEKAEKTAVGKVKKFRRIKIVRAEGEECEEGEITSDEVETDEESVLSRQEAEEVMQKPENDFVDATSPNIHAWADAEEGDATQESPESARVPQGCHGDTRECPPNPGNHGNNDDDNCENVSVDADGDTSPHIVVDVNSTKSAADASQDVTVGAVVNKILSSREEANAAPSTRIKEDIENESLIVFAKGNWEMESEENVGQNSDKECRVDHGIGEVNTEDDADVDCSKKIKDNASKSENSEDDSNRDTVENIKRVPQTAPPAMQAQGAPAKPSGRKVSQELEVLELELRARAIRSLMKRYGKDVG